MICTYNELIIIIMTFKSRYPPWTMPFYSAILGPGVQFLLEVVIASLVKLTGFDQR